MGMAQAASVLRKMELKSSNFKRVDKLYPTKRGSVRPKARIYIETMVRRPTFSMRFIERIGVIESVADTGKKVIIKASFKNKLEVPKQKILNSILRATDFKLEKGLRKCFTFNFIISDLKRILNSNDVEFDIPRGILDVDELESSLYIRVNNDYYEV